MIDYAARRFREEVTAWPDGSYEGDAYVDHDPLGNPDIHLHVKISVDGDRLVIDYTGSDTRDEIQAWSTYGNTRGYTVAQIASMMDPEIPRTSSSTPSSWSSLRAASSTRPRASRCRPAPTTPAPTSARSSPSPCSTCCAGRAPDLQDRHPHHHPGRRPPHRRDLHRPLGRGVRRDGATRPRAWMPGAAGPPASATCGRPRRRSTRACSPTSSGAGTTGPTRAGRASGEASAAATTARCRVPSHVYTYVVGMKYPMPGIAGGGSGEPNAMVLRADSDDPYRVTHTADWVPMEAGDIVQYDYGGGGGWVTPWTAIPKPCSTTSSTSTSASPAPSGTTAWSSPALWRT